MLYRTEDGSNSTALVMELCALLWPRFVGDPREPAAAVLDNGALKTNGALVDALILLVIPDRVWNLKPTPTR